MIVYKATNLLNNKVYVGYTTKTLPERIAAHLNKANCLTQKTYTQAFKLALRKYGKDNFVWEELATCANKEEACLLEQKFIKELNSITPNGYNMTLGGEGGIPNQLVREKISKSVKEFHKKNPGYTSSFYLAKSTPAERSLRAKKAYLTKKENGYVRKSGYTQSRSSRQKMSITKGALNACIWYNINTGETIVASIVNMSTILKISRGTLDHIKHGRQKTSKTGWTFLTTFKNAKNIAWG